MHEGLRGLSKEKTLSRRDRRHGVGPNWSARCAMTPETALAITAEHKKGVRRAFSLWEQMPLKIIGGNAEVNEAKVIPFFNGR